MEREGTLGTLKIAPKLQNAPILSVPGGTSGGVPLLELLVSLLH